MDEDTRLLPITQKTRNILEKNQLHCYGVIPENLTGRIIDISDYTNSFVRKIVCGYNHCLILFNDGNLAGFGANEEGQLGFELSKKDPSGNYINEIKVNKFRLSDPIGVNYQIIDIAAGENFSLILISSSGRNYLVRFSFLTEDKYRDIGGENINPVHLVDLDYNKVGTIQNIYAFAQRSLLLTTNNDIYVGGVDFNQFPLEKYKHLENFNKKIVSVHMGLEHCLINDSN